MDPLALLCTLHADGPATLQRLRARGHQSLGALLGYDAEALSGDLGVPPAAARRFLREAKLLAARVGAEGLEPEEAPPGHEGRKAPITQPEPQPIRPEGSSARPSDPSIAAAAVVGTNPKDAPGEGARNEGAPKEGILDERDRTLVEQILATGTPQPAANPAANPALAAASPLADAGAGDVAEFNSAIAPEPAAEFTTESAAAVPAPASFEEGSLFPGCIPGLEEDLVADLSAMGVTTLEGLAKAQSLQLTRALGITFAQARRLGFLARREAGRLDRVSGRPVDRVDARAVSANALTSPLAPLDQRPEPSHADSSSESESHSEVEPSVEAQPRVIESPPLAPAAPAPSAQEEAIAESGPSAAESERRPFWEPRTFLAESEAASEEPASAQGVKVDPAEIAPRPRFGDRLAQAAAERAKARSRDAAGVDGRGAASPQADAAGGTVLGWNFEIPRPVEEPALPLGSVAVPEEPSVRAAASRLSAGRGTADADGADDETAGPFA